MKILIVGQNPSRYNYHPEIPFAGTKSESRLMLWLNELKIRDYKIINISDKMGKILENDINYFRLQEEVSKAEKVIALGRKASMALYKVGASHHVMPHPSFKNRKLNSLEYEKQQLERCREYLK